MAKTKSKKEKLVDLNPKPEKVKDEQLREIQTTINGVNQHQMELGRLEGRKHQLLHNLANIEDKLTTIRDELVKEYGTDDVNIQDGTIHYPPENINTQPTNIDNNGETDKKD